MTNSMKFYDKLNEVLDQGGFDEQVESLCSEHYAQSLGRPGIPPGVYFRMLFVGYFEGLDSQRGIAWRCDESRSLRRFLGYSETERTPDHSSLTRVRQRLPLEVHEEVFQFVLRLAEQHRLLGGRTVRSGPLLEPGETSSEPQIHSGHTWATFSSSDERTPTDCFSSLRSFAPGTSSTGC